MNIQPRFGSHFEIRFNKALPDRISTSSAVDKKVGEWTRREVWRGKDQEARQSITSLEFSFSANEAIRNIRDALVNGFQDLAGNQTERVMTSSSSGGSTLEGDSFRDENLTGPGLESVQIYLDDKLVAAVIGNTKGVDILTLDEHDDFVTQNLGQAFQQPFKKWGLTGQLGLVSSNPNDINKFIKTENLGQIRSDKQIANLGNKIAMIIYRNIHGMGNLASKLWG